jgi:hypothetical protein
MIIALRRYHNTLSGGNKPSDVTVTVNFNAAFNLMQVSSIIESFSRDLVPEYCQSFKSGAGCTAHPCFIESLYGCSNRSLPCLPLHMHAEQIIPIFLTSNLDSGLHVAKAPNLTELWLYEMFEVFEIVRINQSMSRGAILNYRRQ